VTSRSWSVSRSFAFSPVATVAALEVAAVCGRSTLFAGVVGLGLLSFGCGHERMLPASTARVVVGAPTFAVVEKDGVRIAASGDDWTDRPADLPSRLTPVKVRIINHSGRALQILYDRFVLAGAHDRVYRPLPLVPILHEHPIDTVGTVSPYFASTSFFVRPAYRDLYPSLPVWPTRMPTDNAFYQQQYKLWGEDLPTREIQRLGLPEGVLADGGEMSGFLFFENATGRERRLALKAHLDDGRGGGTSISIPFRVE
jgi:hypothetical protein